MLCTAKSDTLCTEFTCFLCISRCVCIGTYFHSTIFVSPIHDAAKLTSNGSIYCWDNAIINISGRAVDGDGISLFELFAIQSKFLVCLVHVDVTTAGYTACTHTTCNNGCMACHTTTDGQDTLGSFHTSDIFWRCLKTNKNNFFSAGIPLYCILSSKYNFTTSSSRRSTKCFCHRCSSLQCSGIELWMKKGVQITRINHYNCLFFGSHSLINKVAGNFKSSLGGSLTITGLQHVEFLIFNSKLHILHISVVILQSGANLFKLSKCLWEFLLHLSDRHRCTNTGNHILTLGILQELTHKFLLAGSWITGKGNTCTTVVTHITECHGLYVYSSTPGVRDIIVTTVYIRTRVVPGTEYGFDRTHQLLFRIIREV